MKIVPDRKTFTQFIKGEIEKQVIETVTFNVRGYPFNIPEMYLTDSCAKEMDEKIDSLYNILSSLDVICIKYFGESAWNLHAKDFKLELEYLLEAWKNNISFDMDELVKQAEEFS